MTEPPTKKQKRDQHRAKFDDKNEQPETASLPRKKHFRQRAHANPFSDHQLE